MKTPVILLLCLSMSGTLIAAGMQAEPDRIITAEEIEQSGLVRLCDILSLVTEWDAVTVDGFNWQFQPAGQFPDYRSRWQLLLDGQELELGRFGYPALNALPVKANQIERIEIYNSPVVLQTGIATEGVVHIHTLDRLDSNGLAGHLDYAAGNETGDPGPFRYTEQSSRNVDRTGVDMVARLDYQPFEGSYSRLSLYAADHYPTDETAYWRNLDVFQERFPMQLAAGGLLKSSLCRGDNCFTALAGHYRAEDLLYFDPAGGEVPLRDNWIYFGLSGILLQSSGTELRFTGGYSRQELGQWYSDQFPSFDWRSDLFRSTLSWRGWGSTPFRQLAIQLSHRSTTSIDRQRGITRVGACATTAYQIGRSAISELSLQLQTGQGGVGGSLLLSHSWQPRSNQRLDLHAAATMIPPGETADFWFWTAEGFDFLEANSIQQDGGVQTPTTLRTAACNGRWRLDGSGWQLQLKGCWRHQDRLQLFRQEYLYDPVEDRFSSSVAVLPGQWGQLGTAGLRCSWSPFSGRQSGRGEPLLTQIVEWQFQQLLAGSRLFREQWHHHPAHRIGLKLIYRGPERFTLTAAMGYRSGTDWPEFHQAVESAGELYRSPLPAVTTCDLGLQKRLWQQRLQASILVRNLFNATDLYHPLGAHFDLSLFLRLQMTLAGGGSE